MRFSCPREELIKALSILNDVIPPRSPKPVYQNIRFDGQADGSLCLSATDLEIGIRYRLMVNDLADPETVYLPAARLFGLLKEDWAQEINFASTGEQAKLSMDNRQFSIQAFSGDEFSVGREIGDQQCFIINGEDIVEAVAKTAFATARGETRYALNGIFLSLQHGGVEFVASDTHRLSLVRKKLRSAPAAGAEAIVITKGMQELAKLSQGQETVKVVLTSHELIAETASACLVSRLVDGQFPRYRDVIPKDMSKKLTCSREKLLSSLRLTGQASNEETRSIRMTAGAAEGAVLSAAGSEGCRGTVPLEAVVEGEGIDLCFNFTYLVEMLRAVHGEEVTLNFRDNDSPLRMDCGDFIHIIMPIKAPV